MHERADAEAWALVLGALALALVGFFSVLAAFGAIFWTAWAWWLRGRHDIEGEGIVLAFGLYLLANVALWCSRKLEERDIARGR